MADPLAINVQLAPKATPVTYTVPGSSEIEPIAAFASFDGSGAASAFLPSLAFYSAGGLLIARAFPTNTVAAGGSADVSYFPGVGGGGGGGAGSTAIPVQIALDTPDTAGAAYPAYSGNNGFTNALRIVPAFTKTSGSGIKDGTWEGSVRIPSDYAASGAIILSCVTNDTAGAVRLIVSTSVVAVGVSEDTAYTAEAAQNVTVPGTALRRFDTTFTLSTTLVAGSTLNVKVQRNGSSASDTLASDVLLWECILQYAS